MQDVHLCGFPCHSHTLLQIHTGNKTSLYPCPVTDTTQGNPGIEQPDHHLKFQLHLDFPTIDMQEVTALNHSDFDALGHFYET